MYSLLRHLPALFWKRRPIQLTYFVTRRCNAHCPYCFYRECTDDHQTDSDELDLHEIHKVAASLGKLLWLAFSGGEIFLRKDLLEISRAFYLQNKPCIMLYPTNGMQPILIAQVMERILTACPKSVIVVKLSLDGLGEQHDRLRNTAQSFSKTMQTYQALTPLLRRYDNFELGFNTVFCAENQQDMSGIIDYVASLEQAPLHTISMVRGKLRMSHYQDVDLQLYQQATRQLAENMQKRHSSLYRFNGARLKAAQDVLQRRLNYQTLLQQTRQIPCYAGRTNLVLGETGEVYPCEMQSQSFGNVREHGYDLGRVLAGREAKAGITAIRNGGCFCSHECYMMTNTLLNPRLYPIMVKEYLALL